MTITVISDYIDLYPKYYKSYRDSKEVNIMTSMDIYKLSQQAKRVKKYKTETDSSQLLEGPLLDLGYAVLLPLKGDGTLYDTYDEYLSNEEIDELFMFLTMSRMSEFSWGTFSERADGSFHYISGLFPGLLKLSLNGKPLLLSSLFYTHCSCVVDFGEVFTLPLGVHWSFFALNILNATEVLGKGTGYYGLFSKGLNRVMSNLRRYKSDSLYFLKMVSEQALKGIIKGLSIKGEQTKIVTNLLQKGMSSSFSFGENIPEMFSVKGVGLKTDKLSTISDLYRFGLMKDNHYLKELGLSGISISESAIAPIILSLVPQKYPLFWLGPDRGQILFPTKKDGELAFQDLRSFLGMPSVVSGKSFDIVEWFITSYLSLFKSASSLVKYSEMDFEDANAGSYYTPYIRDKFHNLLLKDISGIVSSSMDTLSYIAYNGGILMDKGEEQLGTETENSKSKYFGYTSKYGLVNDFVLYGFKNGQPVKVKASKFGKSWAFLLILKYSNIYFSAPYTGLRYDSLWSLGLASLENKKSSQILSLSSYSATPFGTMPGVKVDSQALLWGVRVIFQEALYLLGSEFLSKYIQKSEDWLSNTPKSTYPAARVSFDSRTADFTLKLVFLNGPISKGEGGPSVTSKVEDVLMRGDFIEEFPHSEPYVIRSKGEGSWEVEKESWGKSKDLSGYLGSDWVSRLIKDRVVACLKFLNSCGYPELEFSMACLVLSDPVFIRTDLERCYVLDMDYHNLGGVFSSDDEVIPYSHSTPFVFADYMVSPENPLGY